VVGREDLILHVSQGGFSRSQIGEGGAENNRFASKAPNALTFFLSDGFIEKVRLLPGPPLSLVKAEISSLGASSRRTGGDSRTRFVSVICHLDFGGRFGAFVSASQIAFPDLAGLTRSGARKASEIVMLTFRRCNPHAPRCDRCLWMGPS
jgi:hypothetical protein